MAKFKRGNLDLKTNQKIRLGDSLESQMTFDGSTLNTSVNGTDILALTDTSQIIGVAGSDVNVVFNQTTDNISMYMDAGEGQGYKQVIDVDGDAGNSEINIGLQTEVYLKIGIGSGPNIRMLSGSDVWFYVDADDQNFGNTAAGGSSLRIATGGDIDMYRAGTRFLDLNSEVMTLGLSTGVHIDIDYADDQRITLYDASDNAQLRMSSSGVRLDAGSTINAFSNDQDPLDDVNSDADGKVWTVEAASKYVQQTMSHNIMEPQTINRRAAESLKYGLGLDYLSYSTISTSEVATTESKENVMVALQNGRGMLVYIDSLDDVKYRLVDETGTSFVGAEQDLTTVGQGVYEDLGAVLLPNGNVFISMLDGEFAPVNGTARKAIVSQDGIILSPPSGAPMTVVLDIAFPAVTPGGNILMVGKEGTGLVDNQLKYQIFDQEGNNFQNVIEKDGVIVASASTASVGLLDNTFMTFFADSTGNNYFQFDSFGNTLQTKTYFGGTEISTKPKAFLMNNGNVFLTYSDSGGDAHFQIIAPSGEVRKSETQISSGAVSGVVAQQFSGGDIIIMYESSNQYYYQVRDLDGSVVISETLQEADDFENANSMSQFNSGQIVVAYWDGTNRVLEAWAPDSFEINGDLKIDGDVEITGDVILSGDINEHHNSLLGLQGGDSTADTEMYHLTQEVHDQISSNPTTIILSNDLDVSGGVAIGSAASPLSVASLYINENFDVSAGTFGAYISSENTANFDIPFTSTTGLGVSLQQNVSTLQNLVTGALISVNIAADSAVVTNATAVKGTAFVTDDNTTIGTMIGGDFKVSPATSMVNSVVGSMIGGQFQILGAGSGDVDVTDGYGVLIQTPSFNSSGTTTNLYGLYIEDQSTVGFTTDYNLYSAGVNSRNKIEGILEVDNIDSTALVVTGDIYANDLHVSGNTIFIGNSTLTEASGGGLEVPSGSIVASGGQLDVGESGVTAGTINVIGLEGTAGTLEAVDSNLTIRSGGSIDIQVAGTETAIFCSNNAEVALYYNGNEVVQTTASGLNNPKTDITISGKTGWTYDAKDTLSFSFDSTAMIFTLSDSGGSHEFWVQGVKYTKTGDQSVAITDTEGLWYINYNNSGVLTASQTLWVLSAEDSALVATLYWDTDNQEAIFIGLELHSYSMPSITHYHLHETVGTLYESGLGVTDNANGTLDIVAGELHDEDIVINITDNIGSGFWDQILSPAELPIYYKDGASGNWRKVYNTTSLTYFAYQDVSDNPYWNQFTGGAWQLTPSSNNSNTAWWILATNNIDEPVIIVMGQGTPNIIESVAITSNDINNLDLGDFGSQEFKILYRVMVKNTGVPYVTGTITDFRTAQVVGGTGGSVNDHGALNGLGDNDHVQYLLRSETEAGTDSISNDTTSVTVTFTTAQPDTNYSISCSFINTIDPDPLDLIYKITSKLTTGFTATFNQTTDSANYSLDWIIKHH